MLRRTQDNFAIQHKIQQAFSVTAVSFFTIFAIVNGLIDYEFKQRHENLLVLFATLRILLSFGVILPEKKQKHTA